MVIFEKYLLVKRGALGKDSTIVFVYHVKKAFQIQLMCEKHQIKQIETFG